MRISDWSSDVCSSDLGDATKEATYQALLGEERAQMVFADGPYNVPVNAHVSGLGKIQHSEFVQASGEMSSEEFTDFLKPVFCHLAGYSKDGSIHFQCMDFRHLPDILAAGSEASSKHLNLSG